MWRREPRAWSLALLVLVVGCGRDWRTDMWYQPSLRPQAAPRPEPEHSIPVEGHIVAEEREDLDDLQNPVPLDEASVARGRRFYETRCTACHGKDAHGNGPLAKVFPPAPDLCFDSIKRRSDGFLFATLTLGGRAMPTQREGLTVRDRWDIVNFIRQLQKTSVDGGAP